MHVDVRIPPISKTIMLFRGRGGAAWFPNGAGRFPDVATLSILLLVPVLVPGCTRSNDVSALGDAALPNILWITAEDMSADLGAYGDAYATTPTIDRLAREGVRYTNAFATAPVCSPARFTLLTGVYATTAGTQGLRSQTSIPAGIRGFPTYLREIGYYTTNNVKTDYNTADEPRLIAESWDESSGAAHWRGRGEGQPFFAVFNLMHTHQSRISFLDTDFAELEGKLGRHDPARVPLPPYYPDDPDVRRTLARYYDAVSAMDERVGEILAELEEDGLVDDTIVFFYADHGTGLPRGKRVLYDSGLHVPLVIRFPEKWRHLAPGEPGTTTDRLISFVDFAPTVLRIVGLDVPAHVQGLPFLGEDSARERTWVFGSRDRVDEAREVSRSVRDARYLYLRHYHPHRSWNQPEFFSDQAPIRRAITRRALEGTLNEAQMTYAGPVKPMEELFDTVEDSHQIRNLAASGEFDDVLRRMRDQLHAWQMETRDVGFMDEASVLRLAKREGRAPIEFAADDAVYPLARVLEAAAWVGRTDAVSVQVERLSDPDGVVRYWAAVGLQAAGESASGARDALQDVLDDPVPAVRVAAASTLVELDGSVEALATLAHVLETGDSHDVLLAARMLQLLGERADGAYPAMERVLERAQDESTYGVNALYIRFALQAALAIESTTEVH